MKNKLRRFDFNFLASLGRFERGNCYNVGCTLNCSPCPGMHVGKFGAVILW
jgi:hypothetical protein